MPQPRRNILIKAPTHQPVRCIFSIFLFNRIIYRWNDKPNHQFPPSKLNFQLLLDFAHQKQFHLKIADSISCIFPEHLPDINIQKPPCKSTVYSHFPASELTFWVNTLILFCQDKVFIYQRSSVSACRNVHVVQLIGKLN